MNNNDTSIIVKYLNPITCFELNHINRKDAFLTYIDKCSDIGVGCLLGYVFQNNRNKNVKPYDDDHYLAFHVNMMTERDTPPKWRKVHKDEYYEQITDQILSKIIIPESLKYKEDIRVTNYVSYVMDEEFRHADSFRKKNTLIEIDRFAKSIAKLTINKKGKYLHESGCYDTDTQSD